MKTLRLTLRIIFITLLIIAILNFVLFVFRKISMSVFFTILAILVIATFFMNRTQQKVGKQK